ncbi:MAG: hypothetical protein SGILL_000703 [Bacillariaceae sp.]
MAMKEADMTAEELRIVESTKESRRDDARRCRLAAFGAALRNRGYDLDDGFDTMALDRALRAVLHTPSLVGPLEQYEVDFFADWLGRAYRSKSRLLGFGDEKIPVASDSFCVHAVDQTPKFELGARPLPGKFVPPGHTFEDPVNEPDDFLESEQDERGEALTVAPLPEVNYRHRGRETTKQEPKTKKRSVAERNGSTDPDVQPPKKKSRSTVKSDSFSLGRNQVHAARALLPRKDWARVRRKIAAVGRPSRFVQVDVTLKIGHECFIPVEDEGGDVVEEAERQQSRDSGALDFSTVELTEVLSSKVEFLASAGINTAEQLMSADISPIAEMYIRWRMEHELPELRGAGASNTISKWKSIVKAYARKHGLFLKECGPEAFVEGAEFFEAVHNPMSSRRKQTPAGSQQTVDQIDQLEYEGQTSRNVQSGGSRLPHEIASTTEPQKRPRPTLDSTFSELNLNAREFLQEQGIVSPSALLEQKTAVLGKEYATWRTRNGLPKHKGRGAAAQVVEWKSTIRKNEVGNDDSDDKPVDQTQVLMSSNEGGGKAEGRSKKRKREASPQETQTSEATNIDPLLNTLPAVAIEFLLDQQILSAKSFLECRPSDLGKELVVWRKQKGMATLAGRSAVSNISHWKTKVRRGAFEAGQASPTQRKNKKRRENLESEDESVDEVPDNDRCKAADNDQDNDVCMICEDVGELLICDGCNQHIHKTCLDPPLEEIPDGDFFCPTCTSKPAAGSKPKVAPHAESKVKHVHAKKNEGKNNFITEMSTKSDDEAETKSVSQKAEIESTELEKEAGKADGSKDKCCKAAPNNVDPNEATKPASPCSRAETPRARSPGKTRDSSQERKTDEPAVGSSHDGSVEEVPKEVTNENEATADSDGSNDIVI